MKGIASTGPQGPGPGGGSGFKVVIPARYGSTRLPGKPLLWIAGKPMIQHVVERAWASGAQEVLVATDDPRIRSACADFGAEALITRADHRSGSDRIAEVVEQKGWPDETVLVNLQGDEPTMPAALIDQVASNLAERPEIGMATLAYPIKDGATLFDTNAVKVVTDSEGLALYFSRAPIPWCRDEPPGQDGPIPGSLPVLRHIGIYAYRAAFLRRYIAWPPSPLELAESLEQLRVLWHGGRIHVGVAREMPGPGVDTVEDLARAAALMGV